MKKRIGKNMIWYGKTYQGKGVNKRNQSMRYIFLLIILRIKTSWFEFSPLLIIETVKQGDHLTKDNSILTSVQNSSRASLAYTEEKSKTCSVLQGEL